MIVWSDKMKDELMKLGTQGMPYNSIVKYMSAAFNEKFTKGSVIGMAHRIGVPPREPPIPPRPKEEKKITINDLNAGMCKWPLAKDNDRPPYEYCGEPTGDLGCSWCPEHQQRVYTKARGAFY